MNSNEQDRKSDLYTVKQAASYLQVSVATVYTLVSSGKLGCHRVGSGRGVIRISGEQLSSFLEGAAQVEVRAVFPGASRRNRKPLKHIKV
ncbi:Helix-turn-helix domain protein [Stieleria neptunia]|uniref:Helix-turn-helix domain protein n=1 Tax=Stieleria neptunia TaxID=2527979 RepID=A0A518HSY0_9BACT|nr:helix-turn-helix domain-containing protein [Stieleria neptunia]QDV43955.1 Helix-turn-helix domain protein [Stieleria neptunia]